MSKAGSKTAPSIVKRWRITRFGLAATQRSLLVICELCSGSRKPPAEARRPAPTPVMSAPVMRPPNWFRARTFRWKSRLVGPWIRTFSMNVCTDIVTSCIIRAFAQSASGYPFLGTDEDGKMWSTTYVTDVIAV